MDVASFNAHSCHVTQIARDLKLLRFFEALEALTCSKSGSKYLRADLGSRCSVHFRQNRMGIAATGKCNEAFVPCHCKRQELRYISTVKIGAAERSALRNVKNGIETRLAASADLVDEPLPFVSTWLIGV